jgi:hypothetical protein
MRPTSTRYLLMLTGWLFLFSFPALKAGAQYFGRNKVLYQNFDFSIMQTPHFDIYNYLHDGSAKSRFAQMAEQWYHMHHSVFGTGFVKRNPVIVYDHHADFQQTRAVDGRIDVGTGGVTEALKNRVVLPFLESNAQTDHVLGHELVHAFQYHLIKDSLSINAFKNLPLWMVEGLAEYMSTGYIDAHTAMWIRSAVANDQLPSLKDLTSRPDLYFPYRWGQAFWAYVTGIYGDAIIPSLFLETAKKGYASAIKKIFKEDEKRFSRQWQESIRADLSPLAMGKELNAPGESLVDKSNGGKINIIPSISPDGKYLAFWTEKNLFSLDLYLADAATGKALKRITSGSFHAHADQYSSYESSVAWSPDSRQIALAVFAKGHNRLLIVNIAGKIEQEIDIPGVSGFSNPAWSPDGSTVVVTGLVEGQSDLYAYNLNTGKLKQLTDDVYSDILPSWSPDGKWIAFATDRLAMTNNAVLHHYAHNIALLNAASGEVVNLDLFPGANNLNPVFGMDSHSLFFLSDRDGFRNLYSLELETGRAEQLTDLFSGISGITAFSPAISVSRQTGTIVYNYFNNGRYAIFSAVDADFQKTPVAEGSVDQQAAMLPPFARKGIDLVQHNIDDAPLQPSAAKDLPYASKFGLDYVGDNGVGIQGGGSYGTGFAGGVNGIFSDMTGDHQLFGAVSLNGEIIDIAAQFAYINQKHRFNWGISVSHIPYLSGAQYLFPDTFVTKKGDSIAAFNYSLYLLRTFEDQVSVFASYPFSPVIRIEAGTSFARYYYRLDRYTEYYDETGRFLSNTKERQPVPKGFNLGQAYIAAVGDNSYFGIASPLAGHRYRFEAGRYLGVVNMSSLLADYRKYFRFAPFSLATRNMFMGRYGRNVQNALLPPLFLGYSSLVRGYDALSYAGANGASKLTINELAGTRIFVSNLELRFPLSGPERLSAVKSRYLFTELNLFTDGGIAWGKPAFMQDGSNGSVVRNNGKFVWSTGLSLRLNLFGYLVVEPYYALPWQNGGWHNKTFGLNIIPGW